MSGLKTFEAAGAAGGTAGRRWAPARPAPRPGGRLRGPRCGTRGRPCGCRTPAAAPRDPASAGRDRRAAAAGSPGAAPAGRGGAARRPPPARTKAVKKRNDCCMVSLEHGTEPLVAGPRRPGRRPRSAGAAGTDWSGFRRAAGRATGTPRGGVLVRGRERGSDPVDDDDDLRQRERGGHDAGGPEPEEAGVAVRLDDAPVVRVDERLLESHCGEAEQEERGHEEPFWRTLGSIDYRRRRSGRSIRSQLRPPLPRLDWGDVPPLARHPGRRFPGGGQDDDPQPPARRRVLAAGGRPPERARLRRHRRRARRGPGPGRDLRGLCLLRPEPRPRERGQRALGPRRSRLAPLRGLGPRRSPAPGVDPRAAGPRRPRAGGRGAVVVDACHFAAARGVEWEAQVRAADLVHVSKRDLAGEEAARAAEEAVLDLWPRRALPAARGGAGRRARIPWSAS